MAIRLVSSMGTRLVLAELAAAFESQVGQAVRLEAAGGVDAAERVRAGEPFDVVVLASTVVDVLVGEGHIIGHRVDLATSAIAVGVRSGSVHPDVGTVEAVKQALLTASRIGYSTGPSGAHIARPLEEWHLTESLEGRVRIPPPGVPVSTLLGRGEIDLGFQQFSELEGHGVDGVGFLPQEIPVSDDVFRRRGAHVRQTRGRRASSGLLGGTWRG